jgi:hypothetical protein
VSTRKDRIVLAHGNALNENENMFSNPVGKAAVASPAESAAGAKKNDDKKPAARTGCCSLPVGSTDGNGM